VQQELDLAGRVSCSNLRDSTETQQHRRRKPEPSRVPNLNTAIEASTIASLAAIVAEILPSLSLLALLASTARNQA
jgi:hypothetical protein